MRVLRGTSAWRDFILPFQLSPGVPRSERLTLEMIFKGEGRVMISSVRLIQYAPDEQVGGKGGAWWKDSDAGWIGAIGGCILGTFGALVGILTSMRRGRAFVLRGLVVMAVLGVALLAVGIVALLRAQPYAVWYPLLSGGGIFAVISLVLRLQVAKRFEDVELRRMRSLDLSR